MIEKIESGDRLLGTDAALIFFLSDCFNTIKCASQHNKVNLIQITDPDGDVIAFSTDEELMEALGYVTDGVLKVYITTHGTCQ